MRQPLEPALRDLLLARLAQAREAGLQDQTHVLVVQPGDEEAAIEAEIGFSPLVDPLSGSRFGVDGFQPYWAWLQDLGGWYEMIVTVGNSGFAFILLIEMADDVQPDLLRLCEAHANSDGSGAPCV